MSEQQYGYPSAQNELSPTFSHEDFNLGIGTRSRADDHDTAMPQNSSEISSQTVLELWNSKDSEKTRRASLPYMETITEYEPLAGTSTPRNAPHSAKLGGVDELYLAPSLPHELSFAIPAGGEPTDPTLPHELADADLTQSDYDASEEDANVSSIEESGDEIMVVAARMETWERAGELPRAFSFERLAIEDDESLLFSHERLDDEEIGVVQARSTTTTDPWSYRKSSIFRKNSKRSVDSSTILEEDPETEEYGSGSPNDVKMTEIRVS